MRSLHHRRKSDALVLTGTDRAFWAGANLQGRDAMPQRGAVQALERLIHPFLRRLRDLPYPLVTTVNGAAAGAGMGIALMGDLILCARSLAHSDLRSTTSFHSQIRRLALKNLISYFLFLILLGIGYPHFRLFNFDDTHYARKRFLD